MIMCRSERADEGSGAIKLLSGHLQPRQMTGGICVWHLTNVSSDQQLSREDQSGRHLMRPAPCLCTMIKHKGKVGEALTRAP